MDRCEDAAVHTAPATIAVCVCTCNRPDGLAACLQAIGKPDLAGLARDRLLVLIVDNHPDDWVKRLCETQYPAAVYVAEPERGISHARNRAVREARGADLVAFVDDDDEPLPDWLRHLVLTQRRTGAELRLRPLVSRPRDGDPGLAGRDTVPSGSAMGPT